MNHSTFTNRAELIETLSAALLADEPTEIQGPGNFSIEVKGLNRQREEIAAKPSRRQPAALAERLRNAALRLNALERSSAKIWR